MCCVVEEGSDGLATLAVLATTSEEPVPFPERALHSYAGIDQPHAVRIPGEQDRTYYYLPELAGHVAGLTSEEYRVANVYRYTPFGEPIETGLAEWATQRLGFGARERDGESGMYYVPARYYDPELGRFISEDPIGLAGGINRYTFGANDPLNRVDPLGLLDCDRSRGVCIPGILVRGWSFSTPRNQGWSATAGGRGYTPAMGKVSAGLGGSSVDSGHHPSAIGQLDTGALWAECLVSTAGLAVSAAGDAAIIGGVGLAVKGAQFYLAGRAGLAAVRERAVVIGRGALARRSRTAIQGGLGMMSIGTTEGGFGWLAGMHDNLFFQVGLGDDRWWTLIPFVGTGAGIFDAATDCSAALAAYFSN